MTHQISGREPFLNRTLYSVGVPPLHIVRGRSPVEYRFYELTGDLPTALHFHHFEGPQVAEAERVRRRIRLGAEIPLPSDRRNPARGRVVLRE